MLLISKRIRAFTERPCSAVSPRTYSCQASYRTTTPNSLLLRHRSLSTSNIYLAKRRRDFFSSNSALRQPQSEAKDGEQQPVEVQGQKPKAKRSPPGKNPLRRVAVEAQRSRAGNELKKSAAPGIQSETKVCAPITRRE